MADLFTELMAVLPRTATGEAELSDALIALFEFLLVEGNTRFNVTRVVGLQRTTLAKWIDQGKRDVDAGKASLAAQLVWTIDRAEGAQERRLVQAAYAKAEAPLSDGTLALKILERRNVQDWAPAVPEMGGPVAYVGGLTQEALKEEAKRLLTAATRKKPKKKTKPAGDAKL